MTQFIEQTLGMFSGMFGMFPGVSGMFPGSLLSSEEGLKNFQDVIISEKRTNKSHYVLFML